MITRYTCNYMALSEDWTAIDLRFNEGPEQFTKRVALPRHPFQFGKFKGNVIERVADTITTDLCGAELMDEVRLVRKHRTEIDNLARLIRQYPASVLNNVEKLGKVCAELGRKTGPETQDAFICWTSVVRIMSSFADGIETDDTIHAEVPPEITEAQRKARSENAKKAHAASKAKAGRKRKAQATNNA